MSILDILLLALFLGVIVKFGFRGLFLGILVVVLGCWFFFLTLHYVFGIYIG